MKQGTQAIVTLGVASVFALSVGISTVWANEPGYGHGGGGHSSMGGYGAGMKHSGTGQLIRHLLNMNNNSDHRRASEKPKRYATQPTRPVSRPKPTFKSRERSQALDR